jgi:hypothetical protein
MKNKQIADQLYCTTCGKLIQTSFTDSSYELNADQGLCKRCGIKYCTDCMVTTAGTFRNSWAVSFKGLTCKQCDKEI